MDLKPVERTTLRGQVVEALHRYVAARALVPGDKLPTERELSQGLAVSRTVVREALSVFEARGLVDRRTSLGYFVTEPGVRSAASTSQDQDSARVELQCAWEVRVVLEVGSVPIVIAHLNDTKLRELKHHAQQIDQAMDRREAHAEAEVRFHLAVYETTENATLVALAHRVLGDFFRALALNRPENFARPVEDTAQRHIHLVEMLRAGDAEAAQRAFWAHCNLPRSFNLQTLPSAPIGHVARIDRRTS